MKAIRNFTMLVAVAALAAAMGPSRASAQDVHGTFTLPFAARWGTANLPAGNYTMDVRHTPVGQGRVEVRGKAMRAGGAFVASVTEEPTSPASKNALVCVRQGSTRIIRSLELGILGETMYFRLPQGARIYAQKQAGNDHTLLAEAPQLLQRVPVAISGK